MWQKLMESISDFSWNWDKIFPAFVKLCHCEDIFLSSSYLVSSYIGLDLVMGYCPNHITDSARICLDMSISYSFVLACSFVQIFL